MLGLQRFIFEKEIFLNMTINWWSGPDRYFQFIFTFFFFYILPEFLRWIFLSKSSCYIRPTGRLIEIGICWYLIQFIRNKKSLGGKKKRENRKMFFTSILTIPERSSTRCLKICCIVWCAVITILLILLIWSELFSIAVKIYQLLSFGECWTQLILDIYFYVIFSSIKHWSRLLFVPDYQNTKHKICDAGEYILDIIIIKF